jgi:exodeoxyribonuclease VII large subunit
LRRTRLATSAVEQLDRRRDQAVRLLIERAKRRGQELERLMRTLSYESVLDRGFAIVFDADGNPVKQAANVAAGDALSLRFRDGDVAVVADGGAEGESPAGPSAAKKPASSRPGGQGSLF